MTKMTDSYPFIYFKKCNPYLFISQAWVAILADIGFTFPPPPPPSLGKFNRCITYILSRN